MIKRALKIFFCLFSLVFVLGIKPGATLALSSDQKNVFDSGIYYFDTVASSNNGSCSGVPTGSTGSISPNAGKGMSATAQQKFQQILVAAGAKFNVDPNFIASFYYAENSRTNDSTNNANSATPPPVTGDGNWREPASPYGSGAPWSSNSFTASGPYQFINSTWDSYGIDGNGDGNVDVNDLTDASFGAAKLLAANGGTNGASQAVLKKAAFDYNHSDIYAQSVLNTYDYLSGSGGGQSTVSGSTGCTNSDAGGVNGYTNPFPGGWIPNRLDMGYDGTFKGQIVAPFSGTITFAANSFSNWGGYLELRADQQPNGLPTTTLYFAEGVAPLVQGGHVNAGQPIAAPAPSPYGNAYNTTPDGSGQIEWGLAADGSGVTDPYAEATLGAGKCPAATPQSRSMVLNFAQWAEQTLGVAAPLTTSDAGCA